MSEISSLYINKIATNLSGHFTYLPKLLGFKVLKKDNAIIINSALGTSMFNIACDVKLPDQHPEASIQNIIQEFNGQDFACWFTSPTSPHLKESLLKSNFTIETTEYAMIHDLSSFNSKPEARLNFKLVKDIASLNDFISIIEPYDSSAKSFYTKLTNPSLSINEKLFVGYKDNIPVVIATLYLQEDIAGIFSLITEENQRNKGYGSEMLDHIMDFAKTKGMHYACLSASSDSGYSLYKKLDFKSVGEFECFEYRQRT